MSHLDRRTFIAAGAASVPALSAFAHLKPQNARQAPAGPVVISSGNGTRAVVEAIFLVIVLDALFSILFSFLGV